MQETTAPDPHGVTTPVPGRGNEGGLGMEGRCAAPARIAGVAPGRKRRCGIMAVALAAILAGCVQVSLQPPYDPQGLYVCEDGKEFMVQFTPEGAALVAFGNQRVVLPPTVGATDAKFTDRRNTLYLDGPRALLEAGGQIQGRGCLKR
jgi:membrane-bound inhibitor of C-type lysozyme